MSTCGDIQRGFNDAGNGALNVLARPCRIYTGYDCGSDSLSTFESTVSTIASSGKSCADAALQAGQDCATAALQQVQNCIDAAQQAAQACNDAADAASQFCDQLPDTLCNWIDQGYSACSQYQDQGYNACCDWAPCSWFCDALVWISNVVCVATVWVSNMVCQVVTNVAKYTCQATAIAAKATCAVTAVLVSATCAVVGGTIAGACIATSFIAAGTCYVTAGLAIAAAALTFVAAVFTCLAYEVARWTCLLIANIVEKGIKAVGTLASGVCWIFIPKVLPQDKIKHVILLVMENRSFDHMLGLSGIANIGVFPPGTTLLDQNGKAVAVGKGAPFMVENDPPHEFQSVKAALCDPGKDYPDISSTNHTLQVYQTQDVTTDTDAILCFTKDQVPILVQLATEFAVCDNWFSALPSSTWPNRCFFHAASSAGLDHSPAKQDVAYLSAIDGISFDHGTIFDAVSAEALTWGIYGTKLSQVGALHGINLITDVNDFGVLGAKLEAGEAPNYIFIEPDYGNVLTHHSDYTCGHSQHPLDDVTRGERFIKHVYETIRNSSIWESCVLIIAYDEHGGFFDHVRPPQGVPPGDSTPNPSFNANGFDFRQLGVRVPAVIVSPFIPRGTVDRHRYDHSSLVKTVGQLFGFSPLTERDKAALDFTALLSLPAPRNDTPATLTLAADSGIACTNDPPRGVDPNPFDPNSFNRIVAVATETAVPTASDGTRFRSRIDAGSASALSRAELRNMIRAEVTEPPSPNLYALAVTLLKTELKYVTAAQRRKLIQRVQNFTTNGEVKAYIDEARERLEPRYARRNSDLIRRLTARRKVDRAREPAR